MATINDDMLVERLVPKILSSIRAKAKPVESLPVKSDLAGITSIPCYDTTGEQFKSVLVSIDALRQPAVDAGSAAMEAAEAANAATGGLDEALEALLTKEKIDSVLTGDITGHTHTHLVYYAQVYDGYPDFPNLVSWTGKDGTEHAFVPGNDIYVADSDEPTGYANYKLAVTTDGNAWVRVPQIPEGYRVELVPKG